MKEITLKEFLYTQPNPQEYPDTDSLYLSLCNDLLKIWENSGLITEAQDELKHVVIIGIVSYFRDILNDTGLWRSFTDECQRRYGKRVPFYEIPDDYVIYELNLIDVQFMLWYQLAFNSMQFRYRYPLDSEIEELSRYIFNHLEHQYEEMAADESYRDFFELELNNPEYSEKLYSFIHWLYWRSWMMFPPFQLSFAQIYPEMIELRNAAKDEEDGKKKIEMFQNQVMSYVPTGPLAYTLREWLALIIEGRSPKEKEPKFEAPEGHEDENLTEHPLYTSFMKANDNRPLKFIETYKELNSFFIEGMGWEKDEDHLPAMKGHSDFVIMGTPHGGIMVAKNIAKCIKHPENPLYDQEYARKHAFNLISQRAVCPGDMLRYICENGWVPDLTFPEYPSLNESVVHSSETKRNEIAVKNWDFISRAYLQEFYRGD